MFHSDCQRRFSPTTRSSFEWDFDGHVELGVVGLHVPPVLVSELLKDLANLRLVGEKTGACGQCLPMGLQTDGRCLAHVFVPFISTIIPTFQPTLAAHVPTRREVMPPR